jgi:uncharacterized metal-binding protein
MNANSEPHCAACGPKPCRQGKDCRGDAPAHLALYEDERIVRLHRAAAAVEARHYGKANRLQEIMLLAEEMGFRRLGLAFCIGLSEEARIIEETLARRFEVASVCCKSGGIDKSALDLEQINPQADRETMCNPAGQADLLNAAGTELNIICGLCVGHDAIFSLRSAAPVTTLIAKDRVLGHNPVAAVYCPYIRRNL